MRVEAPAINNCRSIPQRLGPKAVAVCRQAMEAAVAAREQLASSSQQLEQQVKSLHEQLLQMRQLQQQHAELQELHQKLQKDNQLHLQVRLYCPVLLRGLPWGL